MVSNGAVIGVVAGVVGIGSVLTFYESKKAAQRIHSNSRKKLFKKLFTKVVKKNLHFIPMVNMVLTIILQIPSLSTGIITLRSYLVF